MELIIVVQHVKATAKARTYEGRLNGIKVTVELPPDTFKGERVPAELEVEVKHTH